MRHLGRKKGARGSGEPRASVECRGLRYRPSGSPGSRPACVGGDGEFVWTFGIIPSPWVHFSPAASEGLARVRDEDTSRLIYSKGDCWFSGVGARSGYAESALVVTLIGIARDFLDFKNFV